ncbi:MAG: NUDIX domain-containing protein [Candidatus Colwellbacteria bacterium]|nr:NUDIX domain-containing protein [Candidatus Colwellbacteria bacterium]
MAVGQNVRILEMMNREISAGIIVYRRTLTGPKFLLLYHGGHYWNFPKGHLEGESENKETSLRAAIRETAEETGISETDLKIRSSFKTHEKYVFFSGKNQIFKIVIFYLAETKIREVKISEEHEGFGWFLYKDARQLLKSYKDSEAVLKKANDFIREKSS